MLTPQRSAVASVVVRERIKCAVTGLEDAPAECLRVRSAVNSMAPGTALVPLPSQPVNGWARDDGQSIAVTCRKRHCCPDCRKPRNGPRTNLLGPLLFLMCFPGYSRSPPWGASRASARPPFQEVPGRQPAKGAGVSFSVSLATRINPVSRSRLITRHALRLAWGV